MNDLFPYFMQSWSYLLHSLAPLLLAVAALLASALSIGTPRQPAPRGGKRCSYALAAGNLLAAACWCLIYAEQLLDRSGPFWEWGAPLMSLLCLLLLPTTFVLMYERCGKELTRCAPVTLALSLLLQALSLYPGLYLVVISLVVVTAGT